MSRGKKMVDKVFVMQKENENNDHFSETPMSTNESILLNDAASISDATLLSKPTLPIKPTSPNKPESLESLNKPTSSNAEPIENHFTVTPFLPLDELTLLPDEVLLNDTASISDAALLSKPTSPIKPTSPNKSESLESLNKLTSSNAEPIENHFTVTPFLPLDDLTEPTSIPVPTSLNTQPNSECVQHNLNNSTNRRSSRCSSTSSSSSRSSSSSSTGSNSSSSHSSTRSTPSVKRLSDNYDSDADPEYRASSSSSSDSEDEEPIAQNRRKATPSTPSVSIAVPSTSKDDDVPVKRGKKRLRKIDDWEKEKAKRFRNLGQEYVAPKSKKVVEAKKMSPPCGIKCRLKCSEKFTEDKRKEIFKSYWELGNIERQRSFIAGNVQSLHPTYRYCRNPDKQRQCNHTFFLYIEDKKIRVCKLFFKNTLGINDRPIRTVLDKKINGITIEDKRGKHDHHKKVDERIKNAVREHINSIPRMESHYTRGVSTREYISGEKCLADLYRDYKKIQEDSNKPAANLTMYSRIFQADFNISFFSPKKDLCNLCEQFKNAPNDEELKQKIKEHTNEKILSRKSKEEDKNRISENYVVATFDLQAVLPSPIGDASLFYYKSKINSYNFTISQLGTDNVECYFWHEGEGQRGANEIGSCLLMYFEKIAAHNENVEITFYSDNCCGQNKNRYIIALFLYAVWKLNIKSITHKYLIVGHTQNEGDTVHSVIEKEIRKAKKGGPIYIPQQYPMLIRRAKKRGAPYNVNELSHENFFDLKNLSSRIGTFSKDTDGNVVQLSQMKIIKYEKETPFTFKYKYSYSQENFKEVIVRQNRSGQAKNDIKLDKAYKKKLQINERKKTDCMSLVNSRLIPQHFQYFL